MLLAAETSGTMVEWPAEADLVISALEAARGGEKDRRGGERRRLRRVGLLRLFSDGKNAEPWILFTRDGDARGIGFITRHRLPLGYGGTIELMGPDGTMVRAHCTLLRCRQAAPGWYEGALYFNRPQEIFSTACSP